jgi:hypothetical protein
MANRMAEAYEGGPNEAALRTLRQSNKEQRDEIRRLRTALQFYAESYNWEPLSQRRAPSSITKALDDGGQIARRALDGERE